MNQKVKNKLLNLVRTPLHLYGWWIVLCVLFCFTVIPIASIGHSAGEQIPLTYLSYVLSVLIHGLFIICVASSFIYKKWMKEYWMLNLIILICVGYYGLYNYYFA
jgi:lysylphosphatidylglycerol synthetase-like protein (DUF2156 family)